jgi:hypothetical protein
MQHGRVQDVRRLDVLDRIVPQSVGDLAEHGKDRKNLKSQISDSPSSVVSAIERPQFRVTVSCRFRMVRATEVQAASSARFTPAGAGVSPTLASCVAAALSAVNCWR